jgi:hypothetical protein
MDLEEILVIGVTSNSNNLHAAVQSPLQAGPFIVAKIEITSALEVFQETKKLPVVFPFCHK